MEEKKARYSPGYSTFSPLLLLPSFGIRLSRSDAQAKALPPGWGVAEIAAPHSGDAFSVSYYYTTNDYIADQNFMPLDEGHLRRLLLEVLSREEYPEILEHYEYTERPFKSDPAVEADASPQVRITDLRLASALKPVVFKDELKSTLINPKTSVPLETPVTADGVLRWKWETLSHYKTQPKDPGGLDDTELRQERFRVMTVSFAAAALLLMVDLDARKLHEDGVDELAKRIERLYEVIRSLSESLDKHTEDLSKLLAGNPANRPPDPEAKHYSALVLYRMGHLLYKVAMRVGISPYVPKFGMKGSKNWKADVKTFIRRGVEVEEQRFPRAAEVFHHRHDEGVQKRAIEAYHGYATSWGQHLIFMELQDLEEGDELLGGVPANEKEQVNNAYLQLGSCLVNEIDPFDPA
jgi:hypothetical protein